MDKWYKLYNVNHPFTEEMIAELVAGHKISAIKLHRAKYLTSLREAKDEVEYFVKHNNIQVIQKDNIPSHLPITDAMKCLIKNEFTDDAVSLYIQAYCVSYEQAKDAIEEFMNKPRSLVEALEFLTIFYNSFAHQTDGQVAKQALSALNLISDFIAKG